MSIHWLFHAEVRCGEGWTIPPELPPLPASVCPIGGNFSWMKAHWISDHLFFGEGALFPFVRGRPPGTSELCQRWDMRHPGWDTEREKATHWIDFEGLCVDLWSAPTVLVESRTSVRLAPLFSDGSRLFPGAELRAAGATESDVGQLRERATPTSAAIDRLRGAGRGDLESRHPEQSIGVTWQTSINEMLPSCAEDFHALLRLGAPADLRVVAWRG